ncbi:MAG: DUF4476 domain-containing protein [Bacteroidota bacterium]
MKSILTFMLAVTLSASAFSQNNSLIVYSQEGLKFSLILNGVLQNQHPSTNVKVTGLNANNYDGKVIFENKMPDVNATIYLMYAGNPTQNTEYNYSITKVKEKYKIKFRSIAPITMEQVEAPDPQQTVVVFSAVPLFSTNITTTTTTTTTTTSGQTGNGGVNINVNIVDPLLTANQEEHYEQDNHHDRDGNNHRNEKEEHNGHNDRYNGNDHRVYVLDGYNGVYGCPYPMAASEFESAKQSISSKSFEESKLTIAKQIIGSNCMLCSQIKEMMNLFSFEASKLDLAKFAWKYSLDRGNYYKLNDAFTFESSIDELSKYTQSH